MPTRKSIATLKIVIKSEWFDEIAAGAKRIEYRSVTPFWTTRLFDKGGDRKEYDRIEFINGYNTDARRMLTEFKGFSIRGKKYLIKIGRIIRRWRGKVKV